MASCVHVHTTKTNVCRSKFRPALDVPTHNAAEVTERGWGLAVALWRSACIGGAPSAGAFGLPDFRDLARAQRDCVERRMSIRDESISNLGCKTKHKCPAQCS